MSLIFRIRDFTSSSYNSESELRPIAISMVSLSTSSIGDYCRYLAESLDDNDAHHKAAEDAHEAYKQASSLALNHLPAIHPIRLGLALNYSVQTYYTCLDFLVSTFRRLQRQSACCCNSKKGCISISKSYQHP